MRTTLQASRLGIARGRRRPLPELLERRVLMSGSGQLGQHSDVSIDGPEHEAPVYAPHATVRGQTLGQWTADWIKWSVFFPNAQNPVMDTTGAQAFRGDVGRVFFLAGTFGGTADRTVTLPTGTPVFFPVLDAEVDNAFVDINGNAVPTHFTAPQLYAWAAAAVAQYTGLHASLDGSAIADVPSHTETSPVTSYVLPPGPDNVYGGLYNGTISPAVQEGVWLMLKPLKPGTHVLNFGGIFPGLPAFSQGGVNFPAMGPYSLDVTYHITVIPKGQYQRNFPDHAGLVALGKSSQNQSAGGEHRFNDDGRIATDLLNGDAPLNRHGR